MLLKFLIFAIATNCDCLQLRSNKWRAKIKNSKVWKEQCFWNFWYLQLRQIVTACNYDTANEIEATDEKLRLKTAKIRKEQCFWNFSYLQLRQIVTACSYDTANEIEATNKEQRLKRAKIKKSNASEISNVCNCNKLWPLAITIQQMQSKD